MTSLIDLPAQPTLAQMIVVYRGKHDPLCVTYLAALQVGAPPHSPPSAPCLARWAPQAQACSPFHAHTRTHSPPNMQRTQHLMPDFEELACDVVAVSADTRSRACSFVDDLRGAVLAVSPNTRAGRIGFKVSPRTWARCKRGGLGMHAALPAWRGAPALR